MASYNTIQKKQITDFLTKNFESEFTIEELSKRLCETFGVDAPGKSTIYRLVSKMVEDGVLKRLVKGNSRRFIYQIAAGEHCEEHLHMKCLKCGKLLHMNNEQSKEILLRILSENRFNVNEKQTVLLGNCRDCEEDVK